MAYVIKDSNTKEYYGKRPSKTGWYSSNLEESRLYASIKAAQKTISDGEHHVSYPGNRTLVIVEVKLVEVDNSSER